jgi:hypothetical protein
MRPGLFNRSRRELITSIVLVALAFRALVPYGFMPTGDGSLSLQICRAGFPAQSPLLGAERHPHGQSHFENCAFGTAPTAGPASHVATTPLALPTTFEPTVSVEPPRISLRLARVQQPRAPPSRA